MPWTAYAVARDEPFCKRTAIVGAVRIDGENFAARSNQQNLFFADMAKELPVFEIRVGYAQRQIRAFC